MKNKCDLLILVLKTRHMVSISSKIKGHKAGNELELHTMNINISESHFDAPKKSYLPPVVSCAYSFIKYTISFLLSSFKRFTNSTEGPYLTTKEQRILSGFFHLGGSVSPPKQGKDCPYPSKTKTKYFQPLTSQLSQHLAV